MNGTISETESLISSLISGYEPRDNCQVVVCPPYISLLAAFKLLKDSKIALGAQELSEHKNGAFTGEISAEMLLTVGVSFVIIGHSERRQYHSETDQRVHDRAKTAIEAGLSPIICVGETLSQRESGETKELIKTQIYGALQGFSGDDFKNISIAYEPIWAIGTGKTASPEMAEEVHSFIREQIAEIDKKAAEITPILYGGSVKPDNAKELLAQPNIDGALVGGASLVAEDFLKIINAF